MQLQNRIPALVSLRASLRAARTKMNSNNANGVCTCAAPLAVITAHDSDLWQGPAVHRLLHPPPASRRDISTHNASMLLGFTARRTSLAGGSLG
jgi:hypothetical protein